MFKFTTEEKPQKPLTFKDVLCDQFFVDIDGYLCQKTTSDSYTTIADKCGTPASCVEFDVESSQKIKKIFPKVTNIEFQ